MYSLTISGGAAPRDAAKQDGADTCPAVRARLIWSTSSGGRRRGETPLRELTSRDMGEHRRVVDRQVYVVGFAVDLAQFGCEVRVDLGREVVAAGEDRLVGQATRWVVTGTLSRWRFPSMGWRGG
jgi:hypothetical protein